jgi:hypothetical protein
MGPKVGLAQKKEESKIQAMEMKFPRGILGKARRDKIRNDSREQLKADNIKHDMERNKLKWYDYIMHMADDRIPKKMLEMKLRGRRRPRGRPRTRYSPGSRPATSKERYEKEREEMDAGATKQGMGRQRQMEISL